MQKLLNCLSLCSFSRKRLLLFFVLTLLPSLSLSSEPPSIIMGYKEGSKPPYIGNSEDNSGAYQALFSKAAELIGYRLKIVRLPKKRIYLKLSQGEIDFYPSSGFSQTRKEYLYWFSNGIQSKQALLSNRLDYEITDLSQAKGTLLAPLGSSAANYTKGNSELMIQKMGVLPIDKAILALQLDRGNFYIYDIDTLDYYLKRKGLTSFESLSLKLHPNAIEKEYSSLQSAFSIHSKYFTAQANPEYNNKQAESIENQKRIPTENSVAYAFEQALGLLQATGETDKIYNHYFK